MRVGIHLWIGQPFSLCLLLDVSRVTVTVSIRINNLLGMLISGRTLDVTGYFLLIGRVPAFALSVHS